MTGGLTLATRRWASPSERSSKALCSRSLGPETFEQARNKALSIVGNLGSNSKLHIGRVGDGKGKVTGRKSADGLLRWRLDWDEKKGCHINVHDFRNGKQEDASS